MLLPGWWVLANWWHTLETYRNTIRGTLRIIKEMISLKINFSLIACAPLQNQVLNEKYNNQG